VCSVKTYGVIGISLYTRRDDRLNKISIGISMPVKKYTAHRKMQFPVVSGMAVPLDS
jgi:hypothetical protein